MLFFSTLVFRCGTIIVICDILYVNDINQESFASRELKPFNCVQAQDHL